MDSGAPTKDGGSGGSTAATQDDQGRALRGPAPERVGRYRIHELLGHGGMGVVFAAHDPALDRAVAIKLLNREANERRRARMLREAQALARLSHPAVVTVLDVGESQGRIFIAMERIEGQTLTDYLRRRELDVAQTLDLFVVAGRALAAAHEAGVVHGDFKPDNVMVDAQGRVKVLDFGLARMRELEPDSVPVAARDAVTAGMSQASMSVRVTTPGAGTPAYLSPEQWDGLPPESACDQFALCVATWEALFGEHPFGGDSVVELGTNVVEGRIRPPPRGHQIPPHVIAALQRGLRPRASARWPDVRALIGGLQSKPRRWLGIGVGVALLAAATAAAMLSDTLEQAQEGHRLLAAAQTCEQESTPRSVWTADTKASVRAGLLSLGRPYAASTAERVEHLVQRHVHEWTGVYERVCKAERLDRTMSEAQAAAARACLDGQHRSLQALVDTWISPSDETLERAVLDARSLPRPSACLDLDHLATLEKLRQLPPEQAELLGKLSVEASLDVLAGRARPRALERRPQRRDEYERAYLVATELGLDVIAARAAILVMGLRIDEGMQWEEVDRWEELARAAAQRSGEPSLFDDIELTLAARASALGHFAQARGRLGPVLIRLRQRLGPDHPRVGRVSINASSAIMHTGDAAAAIELGRRGVDVLSRALGPDHPHVLVATLSQASLELDALQSSDPNAEQKRRETIAVYEQILPKLEASYGKKSVVVAMTLDNLAGMAGGIDPERALELNEAAMQVWQETLGVDDPRAARSVANLGSRLAQSKRWDEALAALQQALTTMEANLGASHPDVAEVLVRLCETHVRRGDLEAARRGLQRLDATAGQGDDPVTRGFLLERIARTHAAVGNPGAAAEFARHSLELLRATGRNDDAESLVAWMAEEKLGESVGTEAPPSHR